MIRVTGLRKTFGTTVAVDDLSFEVKEGEVVGFLGPNGAGKSTTMRMLTTYLDPDAGEIEIAGFSVLDHPLEARKRLGYLPESAPLYEELGVVESLRYTARIRGLDGDRRDSRVDEMIATCGLSGVTHKDIGELSKGYRQRVGLAQTLIHDPQFLILDEPTTGLDPNQIVEIRELIKTIAKNKTILLSTHILPEVQSTCTRALIINRGRIVADGPPSELIADAVKSTGAVYRLLVKGASSEAIVSALRHAPGVAAVTPKGADNAWIAVEVRGAGDALGEELFKFAVKQGWVLGELRHERATLEDVFSQVTATGKGRS